MRQSQSRHDIGQGFDDARHGRALKSSARCDRIYRMARQTIAAWSEDRFPMVVDDLLGLPGTGAILAEGASLFPALVEPRLSQGRSPSCAVPPCQVNRARQADASPTDREYSVAPAAHSRRW